MYEPEFFSVPGFDIKSGTSQAAPFVSGLLASLKANKQVSNTEIFGRLYQAASNQDKKKYILGGEATWASVSTEIKTPIIRPVMKRVRQILLRSGVAEVKLTIPVRNYGLDSGAFTAVSYTHLRAHE